MAIFTRREIVDTIRFGIASISSRITVSEITGDSVLKKVDIDDAAKLAELSLRMHASFNASNRGTLSTNRFLNNLNLDFSDTVSDAADKAEAALGVSFTPNEES